MSNAYFLSAIYVEDSIKNQLDWTILSPGMRVAETKNAVRQMIVAAH